MGQLKIRFSEQIDTPPCHTGTRAIFTFMACLKIERVVYNFLQAQGSFVRFWRGGGGVPKSYNRTDPFSFVFFCIFWKYLDFFAPFTYHKENKARVDPVLWLPSLTTFQFAILDGNGNISKDFYYHCIALYFAKVKVKV